MLEAAKDLQLLRPSKAERSSLFLLSADPPSKFKMPVALTGRYGAACRIKRRSEFLDLQNNGKKARSDHFLLITRAPELNKFRAKHSASDEMSKHRLGITVTKKVHKRAVKRNLLKRRLREIFRGRRADFSRPMDMVIICRRGAAELSFKEIEEEMLVLFQKARLRRLDLKDE